MFDSLRRTARERYTPRRVLLGTVAIVALVLGGGGDVGVLLAVVAVAETVTLLRETPAVDGRWVYAAVGAALTLGGLAWFASGVTFLLESGDPWWLPVVAVGTGLWVLLDARRDFAAGRHDGGPHRLDDMDTGEAMLVMNHASLVGRELREGPMTVPELAETCDLTESRVREALAVATRDDTVYRVDGEGRVDEAGRYTGRYALDDSKVGGWAFVRENGRRVLGRLARPFRTSD